MGLRLIKGGITEEQAWHFVEGKVTDTRLMGVLGLYLHYKKAAEDGNTENVQFLLYFDAEELGLDYIKVSHFDNEDSANIAIRSSFGGLGAKLVSVSESEAEYLVDYFIGSTKKMHGELPANLDDIRFIYEKHTQLSEDEKDVLNAKICENDLNDYAVANYYLMRVFGKDEEGAQLLRAKDRPSLSFKDIALSHQATFLRNETQEFIDQNGVSSYLCESLVESDNRYSIVISEMGISNGHVDYASRVSMMNISIREASLILAKQEYVTVYEIQCPMERFDMEFSVYSLGFTQTDHETGEMFMQFNLNNNHVRNKVYVLSDDVLGIYYSTDYGQLIVGSASLEGISIMEKCLDSFFDGGQLCAVGRYHFLQSIIYEFANSGFTDFAQFLDSME